MASNEMSPGAGNHRFDIPDHAGFDTADVRNQRPTLQVRSELLRQGLHLGQRRAENNEIGASNSFRQVESSLIHRAAGDTFPDTANAPHKTGHRPGQAALSQGEPEGPAQQTHAN